MIWVEDPETDEPFEKEVAWVAWEAVEGFDGSVDYCNELGLEIPDYAVFSTQTEQVENPDYNPSRPHVPRSQRPSEWTCVGILGQVRVRVGQSVKPGDFVSADGSVSPSPTNLECMRINHEWDDMEGYAVALCLIR
ncbi:hypothetical protein D3C80_1662700 [compost metagenome]